MDLVELRARAQKGLPLYGESNQPEWVQKAAHSNSVFSQLKFREFFRSTPQDMYLFCAGVYRGLPHVRSHPAGP